ncbi:MAG: hypothetical protein KDD21_00980 [Bacteroidetes bacterium]|nr:hypothetical protein [Bacteroidota bacterium]
MTRPTKDERIKYNVDYPQDTDFSAYARLLQSKWRQQKGFPELKLGNFIDTEFAKTSKANFLTDNIRQLVTHEIANKKKTGGLIGEPRIWNNLLSSQPLCFNLFGELHFDLDLATKYFKQLFPNRIDTITAVKFEYSPGRGDTKYIGDHSAFDVFVEYKKDDKKGFVGIEVKYAESLKEETKDKANKNFKEQYATLTNTCGLFKPNSVDFLRQPSLSQIWRDHLLCIATRQDYDEGFFVFLFPSKNSQCQKGVDGYKQYLAFDNDEQNCFYPCHLDDFIKTLTSISTANWTKELKNRYLGDE